MRPIYNDELLHFGVPGMKWGKRTARNIGLGIKVRNQAARDQILHPIHSIKTQLNMLRKDPLNTLGGGTAVLKKLNADVSKRVAAETNKKKAINQYMKEITKGKTTVSNIINGLTGVNRRQAEMMYNRKHDKNY